MKKILIGGAWPYANGSLQKDADFAWGEYVNNHNGELLGHYENFINRSLAFIVKYL